MRKLLVSLEIDVDDAPGPELRNGARDCGCAVEDLMIENMAPEEAAEPLEGLTGVQDELWAGSGTYAQYKSVTVKHAEWTN